MPPPRLQLLLAEAVEEELAQSPVVARTAARVLVAEVGKRKTRHHRPTGSQRCESASRCPSFSPLGSQLERTTYDVALARLQCFGKVAVLSPHTTQLAVQFGFSFYVNF